MRRRVPQEVPGRVDEGIHRVRLAARFPPALRTFGAPEVRIVGERLVLPWQQNGKLFPRHGNDPVHIAVDDRNRTAPVPLPRDEPIPKAVLDSTRANSLLLHEISHTLETRTAVEAVELSTVHHHAGL